MYNRKPNLDWKTFVMLCLTRDKFVKIKADKVIPKQSILGCLIVMFLQEFT